MSSCYQHAYLDMGTCHHDGIYLYIRAYNLFRLWDVCDYNLSGISDNYDMARTSLRCLIFWM